MTSYQMLRHYFVPPNRTFSELATFNGSDVHDYIKLRNFKIPLLQNLVSKCALETYEEKKLINRVWIILSFEPLQGNLAKLTLEGDGLLQEINNP